MQQKTAFEKVLSRKWAFAGVFTLVYFLSLVGLTYAGLSPLGQTVRTTGGEDVEVVAEGELPVRIEIPSIGVRANVSNPNTTGVAALDAELTKGAVRYPGSGVPGEEGNVLIFGHSSYLPVVQNQAYKAFNGIQDRAQTTLNKSTASVIVKKAEAYHAENSTPDSDNYPTYQQLLTADGIAKLEEEYKENLHEGGIETVSASKPIAYKGCSAGVSVYYWDGYDAGAKELSGMSSAERC